MSEVFKKAKVPLIIIMVLIIGFFAYNFMFKKEPVSTDISDGVAAGEAGKKLPNQEFLPLLTLIKNVNFDDKFFEDPLFKSLIDFSEPVRPEDKGRENPFAPGIVTSFSNNAAGVVFQSSTTTKPASTTANRATTTPAGGAQ